MLTSSILGSFQSGTLQIRRIESTKKVPSLHQSSIKCEKKKDHETEKKKKKKKKDHETEIKVTVERAPYYSYLDSTSGQLEPASGARASIPGKDYWPEGTASRVRAARAPEPRVDKSVGSPSYGKNPGSRRKKTITSVSVSASASASHEASVDISDPLVTSDESSSEFVVYQTQGVDDKEEDGYDLDKELGRPHSFIDPKVKKPIEGSLTSDELWWNWRKPDKEQWSRWQRRRPDSETVSPFLQDFF